MTGPAPIEFSEPLRSPSVAARVAERFRLWRERRRWLGEMADAGACGRLDGLLHDVGMSRADLEVMIDAPADAGRQLETLAEKAQIDLHQLSPPVLREAMWVCARCECRVPCKRWLRTGVWRGGSDARCPNAALLRH